MDDTGTREIGGTVEGMPCFTGLAVDVLENILVGVETISLGETERLDLRSAQVFYIVVSGALSLCCAAAPGTRIGLVKNAVISSEPISAAFVEPIVVATEAAELLRVPWATLDVPGLTELRARIQAEAVRPMLCLYLTSMPLFRGHGEDEISRVAAHSEMIAVPRGDILIKEGQPSDHWYQIVSGSLEVFRADAESAVPIGVLGDGESVGELEILLGQPRSASVRARRDSLLIRVSIARLGQPLGLATTRHISPKTIALLPACEPGAFDDFCRRLGEEFATAGYRAALLRGNSPEWSEMSAKQADLILVVGMSGEAPPPKLPEWTEAARRAGARVELALLRNRDARPRGASQWLDRLAFHAHHHLVIDRSADYARLVRRLSGKAWGVVLGGGGARGLAHIGVIRALLEGGVPIDMIAGTSMGAILAAQYAMGASPDEMLELTRRAYAGGSHWADLTLPLVSLRTGHGTVARLQQLFGDTRIEDLPLGYFCVSCNLTRAEHVIHDRGPVALWTRVSCSVPGLLPPLAWKGDILVDGALLNNLPVDEMRNRLRGKVAACDVTLPVDLRVDTSLEPETSWSGGSQLMRAFRHRARMPNIGSLLMRTAEIGAVRDSRVSGNSADWYLQPPVDGYAITDFHAIDRLVELGYEYTMRRVRELKAAHA